MAALADVLQARSADYTALMTREMGTVTKEAISEVDRVGIHEFVNIKSVGVA